MRMFLALKVYAILVCFLITGSLLAQDTAVYAPCQEMPALLQRFWADQGSLSRFYVVESSPERRQRFDQLYKDYTTRLNRIDFRVLSQDFSRYGASPTDCRPWFKIFLMERYRHF